MNSLVSLFFVVSMFFWEFSSMKYFSESLGEYVSISSLVTSNAKLQKDIVGVAARVVGVALSPHKSSGLGNLCSGASIGCIKSCVLQTAGRAAMPTVQRAARNRTALFFDDRELFFGLIAIELGKHRLLADAANEKLGFRGNIASDLPWENMKPELFAISDYNYDYTAVYSRALRSVEWSHNYHLTFSVKETTSQERVTTLLDAGCNVAMVVDTTYNPQHRKFGVLPNYVTIGDKDYRTVDGDVHDLRRREIDGSGVVVLLRAKGHNAAKHHARTIGFAKKIGDHGIADTLTIGNYGCRIEF